MKLQKDYIKPKKDERRLCLNQLKQQNLESTFFFIKKLINTKTGEVASIENQLNERLIFLLNKESNIKQSINLIISYLYIYSDINKPAIITYPTLYKRIPLLHCVDNEKIDIFLIDDCVCNSPYNDNLFFVIDSCKKMNNVYISSLSHNDLIIRYLNALYKKRHNAVSTSLPVFEEIKFIGSKIKKDTLYCRKVDNYNLFLKYCMIVELRDDKILFIDLRNKSNKEKFITAGRIFPFLTFLDSNYIVVNQINWFDPLNIKELSSDSSSYCIASTNSLDKFLTINKQLSIIK